jgi:hypothetical protein
VSELYRCQNAWCNNKKKKKKEKRKKCKGMFNTQQRHLPWSHDEPHIACECRYEVFFTVIVWAGVVGDLVMGLYPQSGRLIVTISFWKLLLTLRQI